MKRLLLLFYLFSLFANAQPGKEAWHWQFGNNCYMDFSSGIPVSGLGHLTTSEGCASISDFNTGQLILYTNGVYVENASNQTMYEGINLWGNTSATQSALIIPKPGSNSIYYIITADQRDFPPNKGVNYSVADITYNSGQGKIILKNQPLLAPPTTEKLTAVKHCNGKDYWIITHPYGSNAFYVYLVTSAGINTTPVISYAGTPIKDTISGYSWDAGYLKSSPNGKKLALAETNSQNFAELYDFDNSSGIVSSSIKLNFYADSASIANAVDVAYGITFSPDNLKLYVATDSANVYQFDLSSNNTTSIISSQTLVGTVFVHKTNYKGQIGAMQIAPDGKIYIARVGIDTLAVINNPNNLGASCNFQSSGFILSNVSTCQFGLPNFIDANYAGINLDIPDVKQCSNFPSDTLNAGTGFVSYQWSTGATTNSIVINSPGTYWVTVTNEQGCMVTDTSHAYLIDPIKKDTAACDSCRINASENIVLHYNWLDSDTNSVKTFKNTGTYWIDISYIGGCSVRDTFNVTVNPLPVVNLGADTTFCLGNLLLNAENPSSNYIWNTGQTIPSINITKAATYWVKVTNQFGCEESDTLVVHPKTSLLNFVMPNIVTPNGDNINDEIDFNKYQFSSFNIEIYNRWGIKIFESSDPDCIWKPNNDEVDGTYFANVQYKIDCGESSLAKTIKEFITVVR